ncbi:MAG: hydrogenase iron-sulfur subunit [Bacillota bacterium]
MTTGVILCRCKGLIDNLDFASLEEAISKRKDVDEVLTLDLGCSPTGQEKTLGFIKERKVDRLVVAACSPLVKGDLFLALANEAGLPQQLLEAVNLREHCAWAIADGKKAMENARVKIAMAVRKLSKAKDIGQWSLNSAFINTLKCDKCKRCIEECPNEAMQLGQDGFPRVDEKKCVRCGVCAGGCPLGVISLPNFRLEEINAMIEEAAKSKVEPSLVGFLCPHAYEEVDSAAAKGCSPMANLNIIQVPCSGAVNMTLVNDALSNGVDGIIIAGCEQSQCQLRKGNEYAKKRILNQQETLEEMFLEKQRLEYMAFDENYTPSAEINSNICSKCGICIQVCPFKAISYSPGESKIQINPQGCRCCGTCSAACPSGAVSLPEAGDEEIMGTIDLLLGEG